MKMYLISDNAETYEGLRMAGVDGTVAHTGEAVMTAFYAAASDADVAIIAVTEKAYSFAAEKIDAFMTSHTRPMVTRVPDRHGASSKSDSMSEFIKSGIGLKF